MPNSQNLRFFGEPLRGAEDEHPRGEWLAQSIAAKLNERGWVTASPDNWRDAGWSFPCRRGGAELEVVLAALDTRTEWMLQVAPLRGTGFLVRLLGRRPSATPHDCLDVARAVHGVLPECGAFKGLQWRWDGMPEQGKSTPEPTHWEGGAGQQGDGADERRPG